MHGHGRRRHPSITRSSAPQTSLSANSWTICFEEFRVLIHPFIVFELPDELILSMRSYIFPEPRFAGHYARLRLQYGMVVDGYHQSRTQFLLSLSMTCRTMHVRLRPWVWERVECPELVTGQSSETRILRKFNTITETLLADTSLASSVRYFTIPSSWVGADPCPLKAHDGLGVVE